MKTNRSTLRISFIAIVAAVAAAVPSFAGQPNMEAALSDLQAARAALMQASHDKAGWRVAALHKINGAIADVENGIQAGR